MMLRYISIILSLFMLSGYGLAITLVATGRITEAMTVVHEGGSASVALISFVMVGMAFKYMNENV